MRIDADLVRALLAEQFPEWAGLEVRTVHPGGWDHRSFRLGAELVARLPSDAAYYPQIEKEHRWLPKLAGHLPVEVPVPIALGAPGCGYPWPWSVRRWIDATVARSAADHAREIAGFLAALQRIDAGGGPAPGAHNFHRGGELAAYADQVRRALVILEGRIDDRTAMGVWDAAARTRWSRDPVWVHGDVSAANLLERDGRLAAVIDFGNLAVGDPACDLAIAWTWPDSEARRAFRDVLALDDATWLRGRAWALWKALVVASGQAPTNAIDYQAPLEVIARCLHLPSRPGFPFNQQ